MDILIQDLQKTIEALEILSNKPQVNGEQIDELLDQLFQHKIDLLSASLHTASQPYQQAAQAIKQAASKTGQAAKDPTKADEAAAAIAGAIIKLTKLLDSVVPIS